VGAGGIEPEFELHTVIAVAILYDQAESQAAGVAEILAERNRPGGPCEDSGRTCRVERSAALKVDPYDCLSLSDNLKTKRRLDRLSE
jgi:uncharacterized membrane protein